MAAQWTFMVYMAGNNSLRPPDLQQSNLRGLRLIHQRG